MEKYKESDNQEQIKRQKKAMRNRALGVALALAAFVVLIYIGALAKLSF